LAFLAARAHCWLMVNLAAAQTTRQYTPPRTAVLHAMMKYTLE